MAFCGEGFMGSGGGGGAKDGVRVLDPRPRRVRIVSACGTHKNIRVSTR